MAVYFLHGVLFTLLQLRKPKIYEHIRVHVTDRVKIGHTVVMTDETFSPILHHLRDEKLKYENTQQNAAHAPANGSKERALVREGKLDRLCKTVQGPTFTSQFL